MKYLGTKLITHPVSRRLTRSLLVLAGVLAIHTAPAQTISESFENPGSTINGYTTGTITFPSGDWEIKEVLSESSSNSFDGDKALRINDDVAGASITTPAINGIDTVSFYYHRPFSDSGEFVLQKSVGGNAFQSLDTVDYTSVTMPAKAYSYPVEDSSNNIRIRILNDDNTAQLTIDLVEITTFGGQGTSQSLIKPPYFQDFESDTTLAEWRSISLSSDKDWSREEFSGDHFAEMNGFQSNGVNRDWLVSGIDLSNTTQPYIFSFSSVYNFSGDTFKVKVSTNYDGTSDPSMAKFNWTDITSQFQISQGGNNELQSGPYDLSQFQGDTVYIAFQYVAPADNGGRMQIDDITVERKPLFKKPPYTQDFENISGLADWRSVSLSSDNDWTREEFGGDYFAEMSGFQSDTVNRDWLISPGFDMSNISKAYFFSFTSTYDFSGDTFRVKASTNYDGKSDPTMAKFNWQDITNEFKFSQDDNNVVPSGAYNLSAFNGDTLYVAFQYTAPANDGGRMQIDDIKIQRPKPLIINEVLANNQDVNTDDNGEYDPWVEIYNPNGKSVNLNEYTISDESNNRGKYALPDTSIASKEYVIVWADGQDNQGDLHTNFALDANGDDLFLTSNKLGPVDSVSFGAQNPDTSYGRFPNETGDFQATIVTPEAENKAFLPAYAIGDVTTVDPQTGEADSIGVKVNLTGIMHCYDREGDGYEISLQDSTGGIGLFEFSNVSGYTPQEGDRVSIRGEIDQFNGMIQIRPDSIWVLSQNNDLFAPKVTSTLGEETEGIYTRLEGGYTLMDTSEWDPSSGDFNMDITNGTDTFIIRVEQAAPLLGQGIPLGYFDVIGEGWQYDRDQPYFDGYQIFPKDKDDFRYDTALTVNELLAVNRTGEKDALGDREPWIELYNKGNEPLNPSAYFVSDGSGATQGTRLPDTMLQPGERLVIWADGNTLEQGLHTNFRLDSTGGKVTLATPYGDVFETVDYGPLGADTSYARDPEGTGSFGEAEPTFDSANKQFTGIPQAGRANLSLYPNPVSDVLTIQADRAGFQLQVINGKGQVVETRQVMNSRAQVPMTNRPEGLYLVRLRGISQDWQVTKKVIHTR